MPKIAKSLSAAHVAKFRKSGIHAVGGVPGLHLRVDPSGSRNWILRILIARKRRDVGLGGYPAVSLAQARERAQEARDKVWRGIDPIEERREAKAALAALQAIPTFEQCAKQYLDGKAAGFKNAKHLAQWRSTLATYGEPISKTRVDKIAVDDIVKVLTKDNFWSTKTETASRVRGRIESVLAWATVLGYRAGDNPARWKGNLDAVPPFSNDKPEVKHHKAMPHVEVPAFISEIQNRKGMATRALELLILTGVRSGEVRGARWNEFDLGAAVWTIPAARMKAGVEHKVPLTGPALEILHSLPRWDDADDGLVFYAPRGGELSDMALAAVMRRAKRTETVHGFRSSFRDWAADNTSFPREVCEQALAHKLQGVEAAYRRSDLFKKRCKLMAAWTAHCIPVKCGNVRSIRRG